MSVFQRLFRVGKANVNAAIDKLEEPVKIIDQVLRELDEDIAKVTAAVTSQMAVEKKFARELEEAEKLVEHRDNQARKALEMGNEDAAREFLQDKKRQVEKRDTLKSNHERAKATSDKLRGQLNDLKARVTEMKDQRDTLIAQVEAAKAQERSVKAMSGVGTNDHSATFKRMEEKIMKMHDEADAAFELAGSDKSLDDKFDELLKESKDNEIEDELAALKAELNKAD